MKNFALSSLIAAAIATPLPAFALEDPVIVYPEHLAASDALKDVEHWKEAQDFALQMGAMYGASLGSGKVVKSAPYAAEVITETSQTLADGNVIARRKTGSIYRDSEGRTRQETAMPVGKERTVFITDPVANMNFTLSPGSKRAVGIARAFVMKHEGKDKEVIRLGSTEIRIEDGKVWIDGKEVNLPKLELKTGGKNVVVENGKVTIDGRAIWSGNGSPSIIVNRVEGEDGVQREEVRVQVIRASSGASGGTEASDVFVVPRTPRAPRSLESLPPIPPLPPLPGVQTLRFDTAHLGKGVTTSLGTKDFDGVKAEGKATTWTIPAGQIGNRNAITVMRESWYSPELQVTMYTRHADPRTGESIYRLASIRRGEPAADLFKVPDDYSMSKKRAPKG